MLATITSYFKSAPKIADNDRYGILSPLLATGDFVRSTKDLMVTLKAATYADLVSGHASSTNPHVQQAVGAYKTFVNHLPSQYQRMEKNQPFSAILLALDSIDSNTVAIEDNYQILFSGGTDAPETQLKSSSLLVIGYLEKAESFATWLCSLAEHLSCDTGDMIPPFRTKDMVAKASEMAEFAVLNLDRWNGHNHGLLNEIKGLQSKGLDLQVQSANGDWIDGYAHDNQFNMVEQDLMTASLRSSTMMGMTYGMVKIQNSINLMTSKKDWLTSKIVQLQAKQRGMDPDTPEYKRMKKATEYYSDLVSKYSQKIERMRG